MNIPRTEGKRVWRDFRETTFNERLKIGYSQVKQRWANAPAHFTNKSLQICGHPVMNSWEKNYMKLLANIATSNGGDIVEVGYGMGISAKFIQTNINIQSHIIIEANKDVFEKAVEFAQQDSKKIKPVFGFWEEIIPEMEDNSISGILFDTYPLSEDEIHRNHFPFFKHAYRILKPGGVLTYYSDEATDFSDDHVQELVDAGFSRINSFLCEVNPPPDCKYWKSNTILAPIIVK